MDQNDSIRVPDGQRRKIIDEIRQYTRVPKLENDEFTASQYAERAGVGVRSANNMLPQLVKEGILERRKVKYEGRYVYAYRKVEEVEKEEG